jgi:proteasome lid subunit RPN8/RPN11
MNDLVLQPEHDQAIRSHGERAFPHECCGFLLGKVQAGRFIVRHVLPATNAKGQEEAHNRFYISPEASFRAEKAARLQQLDIIGHYHSHPNSAARPSSGFADSDLDNATWPGSAFAIVSVRDGKAAELTSWLLADDRSRFIEQPVTLSTTQESA